MPLVLVILGGGQVDLSYAKTSSKSGAILWVGYPSQSGGDALAQILTGAYSPSGRLVVTQYPADYVNQVSMIDQSMRPSASNPGRTYRFYTGQAIYPFGFGLSYTTFNYSMASTSFDSRLLATKKISVPTLHTADLHKLGLSDKKAAAVQYSVNVTNTGKVVSDVSVLGFLTTSPADRSHPAGQQPPISTLYGFDKVLGLAPGKMVTVYFYIQVRQLLHIDPNGDKWLLPGEYQSYWGDSKNKELQHSFTIEGEPLLLEEWKGKYKTN